MSDSMATSAQVRSQLIQALTLDLVGPTPDILAQLELDGRTEEATELREELLDRPPNRWYQSGFLIPSETSLGDRADDAADDEFAFQGQLQTYGAIISRSKLCWRYRWPDSVRDDVLARLLALNGERYEEEVAMGLQSKGAKGGWWWEAAWAAAQSQPAGESELDHSEQIGLGL